MNGEIHREQDVTPDQPLPASAQAGERIESLDFIRGIAVMGILAANIVAFGQPFSAYVWPDAFLVPVNDPGGWQWIAQFVLIDGKMRGLFTLLFGAGMVLFVEKARARGATRWLQARRLAWLFAFGMLHLVLLWRGDILTTYAVCGMVMLLAVNLGTTQLIAMALTIYVTFSIAWAGVFGSFYALAETAFGRREGYEQARAEVLQSKALALADDKLEVGIRSAGSWPEFVLHQANTHAFDWASGLTIMAGETIPLIMLGMALYRLGLFDGRFDPRAQRTWGWIGVVSGSALTLLIALWVRSEGFTYFGTLLAFVGIGMLPRLPVILGLAALLALWSPHATGWLAERVRAAGRMAFSNYIGTSFVMLFVFSGWALGLFGELDRPQLYLVVGLAWVLMLACSKPWLARFRYGPLEWVWRCLTYGRVFPIRR